MADNTLTLAQLREIETRVARDTEESDDYGPSAGCNCAGCTAYRDRALLCTALLQLLDGLIIDMEICGVKGTWDQTKGLTLRIKDVAIDELLRWASRCRRLEN